MLSTRRSRLRALPVGLFVLFMLDASSSHAILIPQPGLNEPCLMTASWRWTFQPPENDKTQANGPWTASVQTQSVPLAASVRVTVQHTDGAPPCDAGHGPNGESMVMTGNIRRALAGAAFKTAQVDHDNHRDFGSFTATISAIDALGIHVGKSRGVGPSFRNLESSSVPVTITPGYRKPDGTLIDGPARGPFSLGPGDALPPDAASAFDSTFQGGTLAHYKVEYPTSSTTLAFLGEVNGTPGELDLDGGLALLGEILAPGLNNDTMPLYIGVDLTQWLKFPTAFSAGDVFSIQDGLSDLLPGFLIGTSPVVLGPDGYVTGDPFTGQVFVGAAIDGHIVSAPGTLPIAGLLLALIALLRRRLRVHPEMARSGRKPAAFPVPGFHRIGLQGA